MAEAKEMKTRLEQEFPQVKEIFFGQISPALVVHTGPGLLGVGVQLLDVTGFDRVTVIVSKSRSQSFINEC